MKTVSIIRDRGQLTIPGSIRSKLPWTNVSSAVTITIVKPDEISIRPKRHIDWDHIWDAIYKSRAISGKGKGGLTTAEFLEKDRHSH